MNEVQSILNQAPMVPVLTIDDIESAVPLGRALAEGGLPVLEVTLRTDDALEAIRLLRAEVPEAIVGAGTICTPSDFEAACKAGSQFIVSPGLTDPLLSCARDSDVPSILGVATASELMTALDYGLDCLKFFPAEASGGVAMLKSFAGPFGHVSFCPTGGIGPKNMQSYLELPNVLTVGGSWVTPASLVAAGDWAAIRDLALETSNAIAAINATGEKS